MNQSNVSRSPAARGLQLAALGSVALVVALAFAQRGSEAKGGAPNPIAPAPAAAPRPVQLELLHAEAFTLDQPYLHRWRADLPAVDRGWLLVVAGDAAALQTRQLKMPVLQVGAMTAERVNHAPDGKLVVLVPGDFALQDAPIFLGTPALPEELSAPTLEAELAAARAAGAVPPPAATIAKAIQPARRFADDWELRQRAIDLVERFSPSETDLIRGWRAPRIR